MPELPEVETVAKALRKALIGKEVSSLRSLGRMRYPFALARARQALVGRSVANIRRRAKYIVVDFDCDAVLLAHLGMTGFFHVEPVSAPLEKHERLAIAFADETELRFCDARRFGFVSLSTLDPGTEWPSELSHLGPEPLEKAFSAKAMLARASGRKAPIKAFIMEQPVVVGVGNIYASEALFAARIDPRRPASSLTPAEWNTLVSEIKKVLRKALRSGGSTIRNYRTVDGSEGFFQRSLLVYGKASSPCPHCSTPITTTRLAGRSTFFCPQCQC